MEKDTHSDEEIIEILNLRKVAVIGMSKHQEKAAHFVPKYLSENGFDIIPVNPNSDEILNKKCYKEINDIKLFEGKRPVVGGNCWMVFCEISDQRRFWLCFNREIITSDKTILLAESNSEPSIVESFLIDEKKTTLPLLISRVLQRLNGQKWFGYN